MSQTENAAAGQPEQTAALPPASFNLLILSLRAQAEMHLGLLHFGDEKDQPAPDLDAARHTIDLMAVLQEKTKGNLSLDEQRLLENSLTELRFRYVQAVEGSGSARTVLDGPFQPAAENRRAGLRHQRGHPHGGMPLRRLPLEGPAG